MMESKYEAAISSKIINAKTLTNDCMVFINKNISDPSPDDIQDIKLVLSELLYNAVIHGNHQDETKRVSISVKIVKNILFVRICDEGAGFDYNHIISPKKNTKAEDLFMESGRGIKLVMALVDKLSFNIIKFSKKVGSNG